MASRKSAFQKFKKNVDQSDVLIAVGILVYAAALMIMVLFAVNAGPQIAARQTQTVQRNVTVPQYSEESKAYTTVEIDQNSMYRGPLILVNNNYQSEVDGINLVNLMEESNGTYQITDYNAQINGGAVVENVNAMFEDFYKVAGDNDVMINSGYRSKETQQEIYDNTIAAQGEEGASWVSKPGFSEHQTGYAFDLSLLTDDGIIEEFTGEEKYAWIAENCARYGFVVRYNDSKKDITGISNEPWHFRYVGQIHAAYMTQNNLCLEEYIDLLRSYTVDEPLMIKDLSLENHMVYFVEADESGKTEVPIPSDWDYEISGNNIDGYIVTCNMS